MKYDDVAVLVGKTPKAITFPADDQMIIELDTGERYSIEHYHNCCESVCIHEVFGNNDLIGFPLESVTEDHPDFPVPNKDEYDICWEWTVYTFKNAKGTLVVKWYGSSNGCYPTSPEFTKLN